jgi:hypothetical protein
LRSLDSFVCDWFFLSWHWLKLLMLRQLAGGGSFVRGDELLQRRFFFGDCGLRDGMTLFFNGLFLLSNFIIGNIYRFRNRTLYFVIFLNRSLICYICRRWAVHDRINTSSFLRILQRIVKDLQTVLGPDCNFFSPIFPILASHRITSTTHPLYRAWDPVLFLRIPLAQDGGSVPVNMGEVPKVPVQFPAVPLGDVLRVDKRAQGRFDFMGGEDEDFGGRDWIKPFLDPAPDSWEESWGADDLVFLVSARKTSRVHGELLCSHISYPVSRDSGQLQAY